MISVPAKLVGKEGEIMKISTTDESRKLWTERVQAWQTSNKSMCVWCRENNLDYRHFLFWKVLLLGKKRSLVPSNFIEITPPPDQKGLTLEVGGFRIQISSC